MKNIPNYFTLLNLLFGCLAILFILQTGEQIVLLGPDGYTQVNLPEKITWGGLCIFAAAVVDFLDGFVARLLKASSELGKQLDSLADVVSFGVAPSMILYQLLRIHYARQEGGLDVSIAWLLPAFLVACTAAWRLARFNVDQEQAHRFRGLPSPAAGLFVASLPLILWKPSYGLQDYLVNGWVLYAITGLLSYLMVSRLPMMALKFTDFTWKSNRHRYLLVVIAAAALLLLKWLAVPVIVVVYVILSLAFKNEAR
ncbi:MAG TPA: CDP-alcohol phosphatidyltransferase family protein [Chitinophagaceae bacterium]|nr:CDP-alcohol phosphatidyltransferase family protein [Chitinophagaceae bacterium]